MIADKNQTGKNDFGLKAEDVEMAGIMSVRKEER
jgi:hypothetical protein